MARSNTQLVSGTDRFGRPIHGALNPSSTDQGTTPGSFANPPDIGGPLMFSSPDTPGMPPVSEKTAWTMGTA